MEEMRSAIRNEGGPDIMDNIDIHFTYRHDSSVCSTEQQIVKQISSAIDKTGRSVDIDAMTASCDAWFYNNQLHIPTVVFGGGSLAVAHSNREHMPLADMAVAAEILVNLAMQWCGVS